MEKSLAIPQKASWRVIMWPSNPTPWYMPRRTEIYVHTKTSTQMFIAYINQNVHINVMPAKERSQEYLIR